MALMTTVIKTSELSEERLTAVAELWGEIFGDSEEYVRSFYAATAGPAGGLGITDGCALFAVWDGDRVASMLNRVPVLCASGGKLRAGGYIFAACTSPDYRNMGLFRELMTLAELGVSFLTLIPSDEKLFETYRRLGYDHTFYTRYPVPLDRLPADSTPFDGDWRRLYSLYLEYSEDGDIIRPEGFFRHVLNGFDIYYYEGGYFACLEQEADGEDGKKLTKIYEIYCPSAIKSAIMDNNYIIRTENALLKATDKTFPRPNAELALFGQY